MIALLPIRGWVGDVMATEMASSRPALLSATKIIADYAQPVWADGHFGHDSAAPEPVAVAAAPDCAGHGGGDSTATTSAHCEVCPACQACHTVALSPIADASAPVLVPLPPPHSPVARFASADTAQGQKPPISWHSGPNWACTRLRHGFKRPVSPSTPGFVAMPAIAPLVFQENCVNLRLISTPRATLVCLAAGLASALGSAALAQTPTPAAPAASGFQSALEGYQPYTDEKIAPWKEANDNVGRIGGWRAYAKEAQQAQQAPAAAGAAGQPDPHAGHGKPPQDKKP